MTSALMLCPKCLKTSELDNLHLLDHSFKREWIGLTNEDLANCDDTELKQALYWEQILKEKNT